MWFGWMWVMSRPGRELHRAGGEIPGGSVPFPLLWTLDTRAAVKRGVKENPRPEFLSTDCGTPLARDESGASTALSDEPAASLGGEFAGVRRPGAGRLEERRSRG